jgi:CBS domain-containing protein
LKKRDVWKRITYYYSLENKPKKPRSTSKPLEKDITMHISQFMVPADKVQRCNPEDTISKASELMLKHNISSIVLFENGKAVGIVTKTDLVAAYHKGTPLFERVDLIAHRNVDAIPENSPRDHAAKLFQSKGHHHLFVVDKHNDFVGLISAWDVAAECAKDSRAWPWVRPIGDKFSKASPVH